MTNQGRTKTVRGAALYQVNVEHGGASMSQVAMQWQHNVTALSSQVSAAVLSHSICWSSLTL